MEALSLQTAQAWAMVGVYRALLEEHEIPLPDDRTGEQTVINQRRLKQVANLLPLLFDGTITLTEAKAVCDRLHREQPLFVS